MRWLFVSQIRAARLVAVAERSYRRSVKLSLNGQPSAWTCSATGSCGSPGKSLVGFQRKDKKMKRWLTSSRRTWGIVILFGVAVGTPSKSAQAVFDNRFDIAVLCCNCGDK